MLLHLHIQNYAIIEEIEIDFSNGLLVITGETGAGKSIIAGALSLVLGERADTGMLKERDKKCIVEAHFQVQNKKDVERYLIEQNLDPEKELILRREINANGKSRAFVNDTPVTLDQMRQLSVLLVDMHQQFDILSLGEAGFQLAVVDALAGNGSLLQQYVVVYALFLGKQIILEKLKSKQAASDKESDYNRFLFSELDDAGLHENEFEEADSLLKLHSHSEAIKSTLSSIHADLQIADRPIVQQIRSFSQQLEPFRDYHKKFPEILERLSSVHIEIQDLAAEMESVNEDIHYDPRQLEKLNERIHTGYKLFKKHNVKTTSELISVRDALQQKLNESFDIAEEIQEKEKEIEELVKQANILASKLSVRRKASIEPLEKNVNGLLKKVGMPNARVRITSTIGKLSESGSDVIAFLFDANKSDRFEPIKKVASGGELSRLMLCIKSLVAQSMDMPVLLFDEIDSGISGEAARQVGIILKELSQKRQVICITHQPQIAGKGDTHYYVFKETRNDVLRTNIQVLDPESRIMIIAKMLSGEKPTAAALENARELVS